MEKKSSSYIAVAVDPIIDGEPSLRHITDDVRALYEALEASVRDAIDPSQPKMALLFTETTIRKPAARLFLTYVPHGRSLVETRALAAAAERQGDGIPLFVIALRTTPLSHDGTPRLRRGVRELELSREGNQQRVARGVLNDRAMVLLLEQIVLAIE